MFHYSKIKTPKKSLLAFELLIAKIDPPIKPPSFEISKEKRDQLEVNLDNRVVDDFFNKVEIKKPDLVDRKPVVTEIESQDFNEKYILIYYFKVTIRSEI